MGDVMNNLFGTLLGVGAIILIMVGCASVFEESSENAFKNCLQEHSEDICLIINYKGA